MIFTILIIATYLYAIKQLDLRVVLIIFDHPFYQNNLASLWHERFIGWEVKLYRLDFITR